MRTGEILCNKTRMNCNGTQSIIKWNGRNSEQGTETNVHTWTYNLHEGNPGRIFWYGIYPMNKPV